MSGADKRAEIHAGALFLETLEVFVERAPVDSETKTSEKVFLLFDLAFVDRRDRLAFAGDLSRHTHHHFAHRAWIDQQVRFRLAQHVDEARRDDETLRVDRARRGGLRQLADTHDAIAFDRDIGDVSCASGAVDDASVSDQEIELRCLGKGMKKY